MARCCREDLASSAYFWRVPRAVVSCAKESWIWRSWNMWMSSSAPPGLFFRDFFSVGWKQNEILEFESANACFGNPCLLRYYYVDLLLNTCLAAAFPLLSLCNLARDSYWIRLHHLSDGLKCEIVPKCCICSILKEKHFLHWFRHLTEKVMAPFLFKINLVCICKQSRRLQNCEYFIQVKSIRLYLRKVKKNPLHILGFPHRVFCIAAPPWCPACGVQSAPSCFCSFSTELQGANKRSVPCGNKMLRHYVWEVAQATRSCSVLFKGWNTRDESPELKKLCIFQDWQSKRLRINTAWCMRCLC